MRDFIEVQEDACESWASENVRGDEFTCSCGRVAKLSEAETVSANPWAIPVCPTCFGEWFDEQEKEATQ